MNISTLIKELQILRSEYGEKEVYIVGEEDIIPITQVNVEDLQNIFYVA